MQSCSSERTIMSFVLARLGRIFFAISIGVFGIQDLMQGKWKGGIPPVPPWTPGGHMFVYITGAILIAISISLLLNKEARLSATILGLICVLCVLFLHTQRFHDIVHDGNARTRAFEAFALGGAAFILAALAKSSS